MLLILLLNKMFTFVSKPFGGRYENKKNIHHVGGMRRLLHS